MKSHGAPSLEPDIFGARLVQANLTGSGRTVPAGLWLPAEEAPRALTLIGHGGYGHRYEDRMLDLAEHLIQTYSSAVLIIDGPVHGARREDGGLEPTKVKRDWREYWHHDPHISEMVADWKAALDWARTITGPVKAHYYGLSMGTIYGLPLVAADPRIVSSVFGMWGTQNISGQRLLTDASSILTPVVFYTCLEDHIFPQRGITELFDSIASKSVTLVGERRPHEPPEKDTMKLLIHRMFGAS